MYTLKDFAKIVNNCKNEAELLKVCIAVNDKDLYSPLDLNFMNITVQSKMITLNQ